MIERHRTKFLLAAVAASALALSAAPARAEVHVSVGIGLPPPIVFASPPQLVALPGTYVYAVPDFGEDIFFADGWWWRPWHGHWYRSHYYDRGWETYSSVPYFYRSIPHDWRHQYSSHRWRGRPWNYERVSHDDVQRNWSRWKREKRWSSDRHGDSRPVSRDIRRDDHKSNRGEYRGTSKGSGKTYRGSSKGRTEYRGSGKGTTTRHNYRGPQHQSRPQGHSQKMHEASRSKGGKQPSHSSGNRGGGHGNSHKK